MSDSLTFFVDELCEKWISSTGFVNLFNVKKYVFIFFRQLWEVKSFFNSLKYPNMAIFEFQQVPISKGHGYLNGWDIHQRLNILRPC